MSFVEIFRVVDAHSVSSLDNKVIKLLSSEISRSHSKDSVARLKEWTDQNPYRSVSYIFCEPKKYIVGLVDEHGKTEYLGMFMKYEDLPDDPENQKDLVKMRRKEAKRQLAEAMLFLIHSK